MRPTTALFGILGSLATAFGAGLLFVPDLLLGIGPVDASVSVASELDTAVVGMLAGWIVVASLLIISRTPPATDRVDPQTSADPRFERAASSPPEQAATQTKAPTAAGVDSDIHSAVESGGEDLQEVRTLLYETAARACAERADMPVPDAETLVDRGEWTDDQVAAAFLAGSDGPAPTLEMRLRLWAIPTRERRRRVERTVTAIERVSMR